MLAGTLLSPVDFFIVNVALPSIQADLHARAAAIQLALSSYACSYAVLLITDGRLGDIYGQRPVFLLGNHQFGNRVARLRPSRIGGGPPGEPSGPGQFHSNPHAAVARLDPRDLPRASS